MKFIFDLLNFAVVPSFLITCGRRCRPAKPEEREGQRLPHPHPDCRQVCLQRTSAKILPTFYKINCCNNKMHQEK